MRKLLITAAVLALSAGTAAAAPAMQSLLVPGDLDPALVLPPPPATGSPIDQAELAEMRALLAVRTPAMRDKAVLDGDTRNASIFAEAIGPGFDLAQLPATAHLMDLVRATEQDAAERAKDRFRRSRPWVEAPDLAACKPDRVDQHDSYPSGHTTMAFAMGAVLARLIPSRAPAILARAADYGESRIVCAFHYPSDVRAGEALGTLVADRLMAKPAFLSAYDAAAQELAAHQIGTK